MQVIKVWFLVLISTLSTDFSGLAAQAAKGDSVVFLEVNFDLDAFALETLQKAKMDSVFAVLPFTVLKGVEVYGHTDSLASQEYNRILSKRRVQSILAYMVYNGLDPMKIKADYYGEEKPRYQNSADERFRNRRCEIYFIIDPTRIPAPDQKLTDLEFKTGDKIRIPNLNFVGNQPIPVQQSFGPLQELLQVMQKFPEMKVQLQGHVCCGNDQQLSVERAKMVYEFLAANGVDPNRMSYQGFSNTQPLFKEISDKEKALNRRVEVYVISNPGTTAPIDGGTPTVNLRAPVLNVEFFPQKSRLYPAGHFMLTLVSEMMNQPGDLFYEFVVFDNINNPRLTKSRAASIERTLTDLKVKKDIFRVRTSNKTETMPTSDNLNFLMVEITER